MVVLLTLFLFLNNPKEITMNHLDLFSGIGGFALGLSRAGFNTVAFCEIDSFCQKVLNKNFPTIPIYKDIRTLTEDYDGPDIELISGGYPCQPFSVAGKRKGAEDNRHLWPSMFDCIKKFKPTWVIGENVAGHINMGLDNVLFDLESEGYETRAFVIPACAINAPHRRDRVWIVGYSKHNGFSTTKKRGKLNQTSHNDTQRENKALKFKRTSKCKHNEALAYTTSVRQPRQGESSKWLCEAEERERKANIFESISIRNQWSTEPSVGRVANGIPNRVDRLKGLGNAVVPQIPEIIGRAIMQLEKDSPQY